MPAAEECPACGAPLRPAGLFLSLRREDGKRVCRAPQWCPGCDRTWTRWFDRDEPLTPDDPLPESFKRSLRDP